MTFELSDKQKAIIMKALTGAGIVFLSRLANEEWSPVIGAVLAALLFFLQTLDKETPAGKKPQTGLKAWLKHIGV